MSIFRGPLAHQNRVIHRGKPPFSGGSLGLFGAGLWIRTRIQYAVPDPGGKKFQIKKRKSVRKLIKKTASLFNF